MNLAKNQVSNCGKRVFLFILLPYLVHITECACDVIIRVDIPIGDERSTVWTSLTESGGRSRKRYWCVVQNLHEAVCLKFHEAVCLNFHEAVCQSISG